MENKIKQGLVEFGIGVASYVIIEALTNTVDKLEKEGKLNKKEGEKMVKEAVSKYQPEVAKYANGAMEQLDNMVKASPFATKKDIEALEAKLARLEKGSKKALVKGAGRLSKRAKTEARKAGKKVLRKGRK